MYINNSNNNKNKSTKTKLAHKIRKILFVTILIVLSLSVLSAISVNVCLSKINKVSLSGDTININDENIPINDSWENTASNKDIENIAIFGIDGPEGEQGRSDCIMIFTIDNIHEKLKLTSIIRDSYADIPGRENKDKINHSYAFGGPSLAVETLNKNFNLNISKFVSLNFSSFPKVIDKLGGLTIDISDDELQYINDYIHQINSLNETSSSEISNTGEQEIDGTEALAYSRIRYTDGGDFKRTERQRTIFKKLFDNLKSISITDYPKVLNTILPYINTNLSNSEIISLGMKINSLKDNGLSQSRFPEDDDSKGTMINEVYYYVFDEETTNSKIKQFIYEN
ncbi:MAG TPA: LytR family transcriptional regulator [Clostridium sp.]|nr:LytR family transcriptional regulator [Clostridium sp.]